MKRFSYSLIVSVLSFSATVSGIKPTLTPGANGTVFVTERQLGPITAFDAATGAAHWTTIVGASPIVRALLLLIGISPRHFLKKPQ